MDTQTPVLKCLYTLHIALSRDAIMPTIWRRVAIEPKLTLSDLHHVIQATFGWENSGNHEFQVGNIIYSPANPAVAKLPAGKPFSLEQEAVLGDVVKQGDVFTYLYDTDCSWRCCSWKHTITVETMEDVVPSWEFQSAWVDDGENACPPEDVGDTADYQHFVMTLMGEP